MTQLPPLTNRISAPVDSGAPMSAVRRIAVVAPSGASLVGLRGGLIRAIIARRHGVTVYAREFEPADAKRLDALGATRHLLPPKAAGLGFFAERRQIATLADAFVQLRPHVLLAFGRETALLAARAARKAKRIAIIAVLNDLPAPGRSGVPGASSDVGRLLALADMAVFHNADDARSLGRSGALPGDLVSIVVPGAGVDLCHFAVQPLPAVGEGLVFAMIARLDREKGVLDFCEAARLLKARAPSARFKLAGPPGTGPTGLTPVDLEAYRDCVEYLGPLGDVRPTLGACHVYVYPSHAEGMPRSVLEAMATGRPIITSAIAGCRDTVDERVNGCLVPPGDAAALAAAMETFLKRPDLIAPIARASRTKAERLFDDRDVHDALIDLAERGRI
jgi:glycosyltransferase involved in cell wall biosynthesis